MELERRERPLTRTGMFRLPKPGEEWRWVRSVSLWPPRSTKMVLEALRAPFQILKKRDQVVLITPQPDHEAGVWQILIRISSEVPEQEAKKLLKKRQKENKFLAIFNCDFCGRNCSINDKFCPYCKRDLAIHRGLIY